MIRHLKTPIKDFSLSQLTFIVVLVGIVFYFFITLSTKYTFLASILRNSMFALGLFLGMLSTMFLVFIFLKCVFKSHHPASSIYAFLSLSPLALLLFIDVNRDIGYPIMLILATFFCFLFILFHQDFFTKNRMYHSAVIVSVVALLYFAWSCFINVQKYNSFMSFNPGDFAIYNQIFFNTIQGKFFQTSSYGSNLACHNSLGFLYATPFYSLFPHPLSLVFLKSLFLTLSVIPFFLITRQMTKAVALIPLALVFMFNPFIVAQHFNPTQEIGFLPFLLLFAFYFYKQQRFYPFIFFLSLTLPIKHHLSLIFIIFGIYAFIDKRGLKWGLTPIVMGAAWLIFSIGMIMHFMQTDPIDPEACWLMTDLKNRFIFSKGTLADSLQYGLNTSNIVQEETLKSALFHLVSPVGFIVPLLSLVSFLGVPELIINLLSNRQGMLMPIWHYNVIVISFILIGTIEGLKKISALSFWKRFSVEPNLIIILFTIFMFSTTIMHSHLWSDMIKYDSDQKHVTILKEAISKVPEDAPVSVPLHLAVHVSSRNHYALIESDVFLDYMILDKSHASYSPQHLMKGYTPIFVKGHVAVLKRNN